MSNTSKNTSQDKPLSSYLTGENKFSLALVAIAFLAQVFVLAGKYFGFVNFSEQVGGFSGEFITLAMLYFGGSTLKSAQNKKKAAEADNA